MRSASGERPAVRHAWDIPFPPKFTASMCFPKTPPAPSSLRNNNPETFCVFSAAPPRAEVSAFSPANSSGFLHVFVEELPCSANGEHAASNLSSKDRVSGSRAPLRARFEMTPQHGSTRTDCGRLPRNGAVPSEILRSGRRTEKPEVRGAKYPKICKDSDSYRQPTGRAR